VFRPVAAWLSLRYLRAQRRNQFASLVALASVAGVAVGVAALIVVLSVMNGFERELRTRLTSLTGHGTVFPAAVDADWPALLARLRRHPGVVGAAPYVEAEAMVGSGRELAGALLEGIDPGATGAWPDLAGAVADGRVESLVPGSFRALVGRSLAYRLGIGTGDTLRVLVPVREPGGRVSSRLRELTIAGTFEVGVKDHDSLRILLNLADAAAIAGLGTGVTGLRLRTADLFTAPAVVADFAAAEAAAGRPAPRTSDWTVENATYFRAVRIEKLMMTLLLALIVAVAAFNIVATLVMVVTDKRPGIAILRTLGHPRGTVVAAFVLQGLLVGWAGVLAGVTGGVALARNIGTVAPALERLFGFEFMPADVYYVTTLPVEVRSLDVALVSGLALLLTAAATLYPALRAAAVAPAEVLRYE
jgi:lipoprotein-releasing system permease protein